MPRQMTSKEQVSGIVSVKVLLRQLTSKRVSQNHLGKTKTGLDEVESPLSEMPLSFCAHEVQHEGG